MDGRTSVDKHQRTAHTVAVQDRLAKFRDYMKRLDGTASLAAVQQGLYVDGPGRSPADRIVGRAELQLPAAQVLIGGIGSGKTTQLLVAQERIGKLAGTRAYYLDPIRQNEARIRGGAVVRELLSSQLGLYVSTSSLRDKSAREIANVLFSGSLQEGTHFVLLIDSLDRLTDLDAFAEIVEQDIRALRDTGVSVALVAPQRLMYGPHRALLDHFDEVYHQLPVDLDVGPEAREFLTRVLRTRAPAEVLPDDACQRVVDFSGGVLRDLISIARSAGEQAYLVGTGAVEVAHVEAAADGFGRKKLLSLRPEQIAVLQRVRRRGHFVQTSEQDLMLLLTGCVLEYQKPNGGPRYAVHPTIRPLLEQLAEER
jgi:hypothetical protein